MTTDNRMTNQFTDEQAEAGALAAANVRRARYGEWPLRELGEDSPSQYVRDEVRAALEAAAGVAPQAPNAGESTAGLRSRGDIEGKPAVQLSSKVQDSPETESLGGEISIPVQQSSTVDEDALAEAWEAGCLAGRNRKHHSNMTEEQAEKAWPNPYRGGQGETRG